MPALGFHLGQSYGAAVNYLDNGTTVNLGKVPGNPDYVDMMARLIKQRPSREPRDTQCIGLVPQDVFGIGRPTDVAILAKMVSQLKKASEATLGAGIGGHEVSVTAPWQTFWKDHNHWDSDINNALWVNGLSPWALDSEDLVYLGEVRAALAASGRWLCQPYGRYDFEAVPDISDYIYYISFTNQSLYTTFIQAGCFYKQPHEIGGSIDPGLGFDSIQDQSSEKFWLHLRNRLHTRVAQFKDWINPRRYFYTIRPIVLVSGEAADSPELLSIVKDIAAELPDFLPGADPEHKKLVGSAGGSAELVVLEDPGFGPAKGAALWSRLKAEVSGYCEMAEGCRMHDASHENEDETSQGEENRIVD